MSSVNNSRWSVSAPWEFRNVDYKVSADVRDDVLVVQVEDTLTADQWTARFEAKHIEELTGKTGNFKQFPVFLNMLESAIMKSSDSVTLDLLTYADLESLRSKKRGRGGSATSPRNGQTQSKRYLILTYSVEFDRIHYPLALPYTGQPDPAQLQETIRQLRAELVEWVKKQDLVTSHGHRRTELTLLQRKFESLLQEKEELEEAFEMFKQDIVLRTKGTASKEMKILKSVVKNLEEELLKEKTKHQKYANKKNEELGTLLRELEDLRLSERNLRTRVKCLTNELVILKHSLRTSPALYSSSKRTPPVVHSSSKQHSKKKHRHSSADRSGPGRTSLSTERKQGSRLSAERLRSQYRTPSPSFPRFDPTAYMETKMKKQQDSDIRRLKVSVKPRVPRSRSNSLERLSKPPSGSRGSMLYQSVSRDSSRASSRRSSISSNHSAGSHGNVTSRGKKRKVMSSGRRQKLDSPQSVPTNITKPPNAHNNSSLLDHSVEISEIDARLNALQEFMKRSLESTKSYSKRQPLS